MKQNMGNTDRFIRMILAVAILSMYLMDLFGNTLGIVLMVLAGILLITSVLGFCPLYAIFGLNSMPASKRSQQDKMTV